MSEVSKTLKVDAGKKALKKFQRRRSKTPSAPNTPSSKSASPAPVQIRSTATAATVPGSDGPAKNLSENEIEQRAPHLTPSRATVSSPLVQSTPAAVLPPGQPPVHSSQKQAIHDELQSEDNSSATVSSAVLSPAKSIRPSELTETRRGTNAAQSDKPESPIGSLQHGIDSTNTVYSVAFKDDDTLKKVDPTEVSSMHADIGNGRSKSPNVREVTATPIRPPPTPVYTPPVPPTSNVASNPNINIELDRRVTMLQESADSAERLVHLQQIVESLKSEKSTTARGLEQLKAEKEILVQRWRSSNQQAKLAEESAAKSIKRCEDLSSHVSSLTKELHTIQQRHKEAVEDAKQASEDSESKLQTLSDEMQLIQTRAEAAEAAFKDAIAAREHAEEVALEATSQRDAAVGKLGGLQRMLEKARGDAELISRATSQNRTLKTRLLELEDRFIEVTNDKSQLMAELDSTKHKLTSVSMLNHSHLEPQAASSPIPRGLPLSPDESKTAHVQHRDHDFEARLRALTAERDGLIRRCDTLQRQLKSSPNGSSNGDITGSENEALVHERDELVREKEDLWLEKEELALKVSSLERQLQLKGAEIVDTKEEDKSSKNPAVSPPEGQDLVDSLYMQIHQLELERGHFMDEVKKVEAERDALLLVSRKDQSSRGSESNSKSKPPEEHARRTVSGRTVGGGTSKNSSGEGSGLPILPDGSKPSLEMTVKQSQAELSYMTDERDELRSRLEYMTDLNKELHRRLKVEQELTIQLAKETETIGEYISLYHTQRQAMATRLADKDRIILSLRRVAGSSHTSNTEDIDEAALLAGSLDSTIPLFMQVDDSFAEI